MIRSAYSGNHAARSESLCDSNDEYTTILPLFPRLEQRELMNSRRGSLASVARNSWCSALRRAAFAHELKIGKASGRRGAWQEIAGSPGSQSRSRRSTAGRSTHPTPVEVRGCTTAPLSARSQPPFAGFPLAQSRPVCRGSTRFPTPQAPPSRSRGCAAGSQCGSPGAADCSGRRTRT